MCLHCCSTINLNINCNNTVRKGLLIGNFYRRCIQNIEEDIQLCHFLTAHPFRKTSAKTIKSWYLSFFLFASDFLDELKFCIDKTSYVLNL